MILVASKFVWSHYPGMRAGRIYAGKSDLTQHPNAATHLADGPAATETLCGLPREQFPYEFAEDTSFGKKAEPCTTCLPAGTP